MTRRSSALNDLANLMARLRQERIEAEKQLAQIDERLRGAETTLRLLRQTEEKKGGQSELLRPLR